jgi:hypothetical protein
MRRRGDASIVPPVKDRCFFVYALAPAGVTAREANDLLNEYISGLERGLPVYHDHFIGAHGGFAIFHVTSDEQRAKLDDPGPLSGWRLEVHPLTFSLTGVGVVAQVEFTLEGYGGTTLEEQRQVEPPDPRYWWQAA